MQEGQVTNSTAHELELLVDPDGIRASVRRLFANRIEEVLGELLQNSQRATASRVCIETTEEGFVYRDNGHGLLSAQNGRDDPYRAFHILLQMASSYFQNTTLSAQHPMGLGIHALLAHDQVQEVTFASDSAQLTLDTSRWWNDPAYYRSWHTRLVTDAPRVDGLEIRVRCRSELLAPFRQALQADTSPTRGYLHILSVTLDGVDLNTELPSWAQIRFPLFTTSYQGCRLTIGACGYERDRVCCVNWYGQPIRVNSPFKPGDNLPHIQFNLQVLAGTPVNPIAPTRHALIQDGAYTALLQFIEESVFAYTLHPDHRSQMNVPVVLALFHLNRERALTELPYFIARSYEGIRDRTSIYSANEVLRRNGAEMVFSYEQPPLLLRDHVLVCGEGRLEGEYPHGLPFFLDFPDLSPPWEMRYGDTSRVPVRTLWWKPGEPLFGKDFFGLGEYGIGDEHKPPTEWFPVLSPIVVFEASVTDLDYVEWKVGCEDVLYFLNSGLVNAVWDSEGQYDEGTNEETFYASVQALCREVIGDCVPVEFTHFTLQAFFTNKKAQIVTVHYEYDSVSEHASPTAIRVINRVGEEKRLQVLH